MLQERCKAFLTPPGIHRDSVQVLSREIHMVLDRLEGFLSPENVMIFMDKNPDVSLRPMDVFHMMFHRKFIKMG